MTEVNGTAVPLSGTVANIKKFQGLKKFRVAGKAVLALNRMWSASSASSDTGEVSPRCGDTVVVAKAAAETDAATTTTDNRCSSFDLSD
jgi:hypothetical protein